MTRKPKEVLKSVFGFDSFKGLQEEIIDHVISGGDALVLMPTGGGKSLCYQIPALCLDGLALVVSPLIALMRDQVEALRQLGVRAAALNSSLQRSEASQVEQDIAAGALDLVYVAPERLLTESFLAQLKGSKLALFAIDEAHCVSQWGHDFRPEYIKLNILHERFPSVPRIALTATADGPTRNDIVERLQLKEGRIFAAGFDRPNIHYRIVPKDNPKPKLLQFLQAEHSGDSGIVYCMSRARVESTAEWLKKEGFDALPYHAGMDKAVRDRHQDRFIKGEGIIMVATIAFGLGIDKPDVRFVAHLDLPKSLESYYQETGRAGRDGLKSIAWLAYGMGDLTKIVHFIESSDAPDNQKRIERQKLDALLGYCETTRCRRQVLLQYFGEVLEHPCGNCDTCQDPTESFDGTVAAQKALSCVVRTGEMFGAMYVIDVLLGSDSERIQNFGHQNLSTFGIGKEYSRQQWRSIFRQLVAMKLLVVDMEGHGGYRLGPDSHEVLRGERKIQLRKEPERPKKAKTSRGESRKTRAKATLDNPEDEALFQVLRAHRRELADAQKLPPYVIFHDSTLLQMAQSKPKNLEEFNRLPGVGRVKSERYAGGFLQVISKHLS